MSSPQTITKERQEERDFQREQQLLQNAFNQDGELSQNFIAELLDKEDLVVGDNGDLQEVTVAKIQNLLSKDWVLANLTDAQEHDIRYKLEVMKIKVLGMHPRQECRIVGPVRAFLWDDPMEELLPLSPSERLLVDDIFETLKARYTRGRGGFERKQMNTNIAETRNETQQTEPKKGRLRGLLK